MAIFNDTPQFFERLKSTVGPLASFRLSCADQSAPAGMVLKSDSGDLLAIY